jgi:hypothetical protein
MSFMPQPRVKTIVTTNPIENSTRTKILFLLGHDEDEFSGGPVPMEYETWPFFTYLLL